MVKKKNKDKAMHKNNLIWIDLEMTGLDPEKERIIEMATIITDGDLNILDEGPHFVIHQPTRILNKMDDWNQSQHGKSGLVEQVKKSKVTLKQAEKKTLKFIKEWCQPKKTPLCGNSVHHDRRFIIKYMPAIDDFLHYRHVDVSGIKTLIQRWYPKNKAKPKKSDTHRALDDIRESIEELKLYREVFFK